MSNLMDKYLQERPTVPPRTDQFTNPVTTAPEPPESSPDSLNSEKQVPTQTSDLPSQEIDQRGRLIRLEKSIKQQLIAFCQDEEITLDVFVESVWLTLQDQQKILDKVVKKAKSQKQLRKEIGILKRCDTTKQKAIQRLQKG